MKRACVRRGECLPERRESGGSEASGGSGGSSPGMRRAPRDGGGHSLCLHRRPLRRLHLEVVGRRRLHQ